MSPDTLKSIVTVNTPGSPLRRMLAYKLLLAIAAAVVALDQASKAWILWRLPYPTYGEPGAMVIIPSFFHLVDVGNTGAAWSLFSGRSAILAAGAAVTLLAIFLWRRALGLRARLVQVSFGLLCGGIVGNLVDRLWHGHVIDFLDFHFGSYTFPTFNVADSGISVGVAIYLWHSLRAPEAPEARSGK